MQTRKLFYLNTYFKYEILYFHCLSVVRMSSELFVTVLNLTFVRKLTLKVLLIQIKAEIKYQNLYCLLLWNLNFVTFYYISWPHINMLYIISKKYNIVGLEFFDAIFNITMSYFCNKGNMDVFWNCTFFCSNTLSM